MSFWYSKFLYKCAGVDFSILRRLDRPKLIIPPALPPRWFAGKISALLGLMVLESYMIYFALDHHISLHMGHESEWLDRHIKDPCRQKTIEEIEKSKKLIEEMKRSLRLLVKDNERLRKLLLSDGSFQVKRK